MGKNEFLDSTGCPWMRGKIVCILLLLLTVVSTSSCSLPRLTVIKDPLTPEEHLNLGVIYEKQQEFEPALKEYQLASKRLPIAYLYMGNVYFQKKEWGEAEQAYKKALKKDSKNADAYNNLAWLYYIRREKMDEAEALARRAIELDPSNEQYKDTLEKIKQARHP